jgi:hypothetical protein
MPWCDACARFWSPASVPSGVCPTCGASVAAPTSPTAPAVTTRAPWHFKLLLVALVLYLGYRAYQGVFWVGHSWLHLF